MFGTFLPVLVLLAVLLVIALYGFMTSSASSARLQAASRQQGNDPRAGDPASQYAGVNQS